MQPAYNLNGPIFPNEQNFDLDKSRQIFRSFVAKYCKMRIIFPAKFSVFQSFCITHGKLILFSESGINFPRVIHTKWLKNGKFRSAVLSAFYNILQRNFGILLILWCSFKLWWHFCLDLSRSEFCSLGNRSILLRKSTPRLTWQQHRWVVCWFTQYKSSCKQVACDSFRQKMCSLNRSLALNDIVPWNVKYIVL
jgi:hypothetical protein